MDKIKNALKILNKDRIRNVNLINFMKEYPIDSIHIEGNSVLVKGRSDQHWIYISSESEKEMNVLLKNLEEEERFFAIIEDWMLPMIVKDHKVVWKLSCLKLYFPSEISLPKNKFKILKIASSNAEYIYRNSNYQQYTSPEYIAERINKGIGLGIYEEGTLVAWILTHDDGAIGFLNVLMDYRGKGYAYELTIAMIKSLRSRGDIPFVHIEEDNRESMSLSTKMGFKKDRLVHWLNTVPVPAP